MEFKLSSVPVLQIEGVKSGTNKQGKPYTLGELLVTFTKENAQYPIKLALKGFNDVAKSFNTFKKGDIVDVTFTPETREYNGKFYTDIICNSIKKVKGKAKEPTEDPFAVDASDDLPF